jgi:hypothetical protein
MTCCCQVYKLRVDGEVTGDVVAALRRGLTHADYKYYPLDVSLAGRTGSSVWMNLTLPAGSRVRCPPPPPPRTHTPLCFLLCFWLCTVACVLTGLVLGRGGGLALGAGVCVQSVKLVWRRPHPLVALFPRMQPQPLRSMFDIFGLNIARLIRTEVGPYKLGTLPSGAALQVRFLS